MPHNVFQTASPPPLRCVLLCVCDFVSLCYIPYIRCWAICVWAFDGGGQPRRRNVWKEKKTSRARAFNIIARIRSNKYCARCWSIDYLVDTHTHSQPIYDFKSRANAISPKNKTRSNLFAALLICYVAGWMMVRAAQRSITRRFDPAAAASI